MAKCTGVRCPAQYGYKVEECNQTDCPYRTEPMTNAERIRAMSDNELAEWIARTQIGAIKDAMILLRLPYYEPDGLVELGETEALQWLKQPAGVE